MILLPQPLGPQTCATVLVQLHSLGGCVLPWGSEQRIKTILASFEFLQPRDIHDSERSLEFTQSKPTSTVCLSASMVICPPVVVIFKLHPHSQRRLGTLSGSVAKLGWVCACCGMNPQSSMALCYNPSPSHLDVFPSLFSLTLLSLSFPLTNVF